LLTTKPSHYWATRLTIQQVEAKGLKPFTSYYYQFNVCNSDNKSPVGRTKTIPRKKDRVREDLGFAVFSCSNFRMSPSVNVFSYQFGIYGANRPAAQGFFNAYGNSARKDNVDYVIHLGDYIYEYKEGGYGWGWNMSRIAEPKDSNTFTLYGFSLPPP
jgi:alkaline phosphatase D